MRPAKRPYIVALTAGVMPTDRERCVAAGMDDFVPKPVQLEEIRSAIDRAHRAARLRSQP
jgi:CheY-like chemotaxis protein